MTATFKSVALGGLFSLMLGGCVSTSNIPVDQSRAVADYMNLARGYIQQGYTEKAVKPLKRALEIEPKSASVYGMLGAAYQMQGENTLAEEAFQSALSLDPDASTIHNNYGSFLFSQRRLDEAYRQFELASQDVSYSQRSRTFENMGVVALRQGHQTKAIAHFTRALQLNRNLPKAHRELAIIHQRQGNLRLAWQYYLSFVGLSQQDAQSLLLGIKLATANGDRSKAASYALQLERLYPGSNELKQYRSRTGNDD